jgi:hypothetical protein
MLPEIDFADVAYGYFLHMNIYYYIITLADSNPVNANTGNRQSQIDVN